MARPARHSDDRLIELFLDMLAAERGATENTLAAYRRDLDDFADYLVTKRRTVASAATDDVRGYLQALSKRSFAAASVARKLSAIRQFYRFLYAEGQRGDDPAAIIEGPKRGRALPKVLGVKEVDRLLAVARKAIGAGRTGGERLRAARLNALLELVYATGLRVSELVSLPASAAERNARMLVVRGKGGKERLVPLNTAARAALDRYLAMGEDPEDGLAPMLRTKFLFPSRGAEGHLTRQGVGQDLKQLALEAGLDLVEISPDAEPPVAKILDFGKFKYQEQKKAAEARKNQKIVEIKEIKMRPSIDDHDYDVKMRAIKRFFEEGDKVKVTLRFRGREMAHQEIGFELLKRVKADFEGLAKVESEPRFEGRQVVMILAPR